MQRSRSIVQCVEPVVKDPLLVRFVGIGDHQRHERADARGLGAGRLGLGQYRIGDLVEQLDIGLRESTARTRRPCRRSRARGQQRAVRDQRRPAE